MKNITISVDEDLWKRIRDSADGEHLSMNAFIRELLRKVIVGSDDSSASRIVALAREFGPAPTSWKWNRDEIYEERL